MTLSALSLVVAAAFVHATWNLLAKRVAGGAPFVWLFSALSTALYAPLALGIVFVQRPTIGPTELLFFGGSSLLHIAYYLTLQKGYRVGDLSLVYPLARGTGPALSTAGAILLMGERPSALACAGIALVVLGVFMLAGGLSSLASPLSGTRRAVRYGLLTGTIIASYTLWDKRAVSALLIPPVLLDWCASLGRTALLFPIAKRSWHDVREHWTLHRRETLAVAFLNPLSYILVLTALKFTPVSYVAPAREMSILIGTLMGTRLLLEGGESRRVVAALMMVGGIIALAVG